MSYLNYFGFDSEPFGHAPSSRFYYASIEHTQALRRLLHCVQSMQGLAVLVGESGCGKTTLARRLLEALPQAQYAAALVVIAHKDIAPLWLIKHIATQLGVRQPAETAPDLINQLYTQLVALQEAGRHAVVLIDEAQMLQSQEMMQEFRGLLNLEVAGAKLIDFVFFGLPSIEATLRLDAPLAQRVAMRYALQPLGEQACAQYVEHRLQIVGARRPIFSTGALQALYQYSGGVPRLINTLCDNVLLEAFFAGLQTVDAQNVVAVAQNLGLTPDPNANATRKLSPNLSVPPLPIAEGIASGVEDIAAYGARSMQDELGAGCDTTATVPAAVPVSVATPVPMAPPMAVATPTPFASPLPTVTIIDPVSADVRRGAVVQEMMLAHNQPHAGAADASLSADASQEDWSELMAVGSLLSNGISSTAAALPAAATQAQSCAPNPIDPEPMTPLAAGSAKPIDRDELASTAYGTLDLDEVAALLSQLNRT